MIMYWEPLLQDISFLLLYGGVIMLEVLAALYLLFRRGNAIAQDVTSSVRLRRWAAAFLLADAISHISWYTGVSYPIKGDTMVSYWVCGCVDVVVLLPTMMGTFLAMLQDRRRPVWPFAAGLLPAVAAYVICILLGNTAFMVPVTAYILLVVAALHSQAQVDNYALSFSGNGSVHCGELVQMEQQIFLTHLL